MVAGCRKVLHRGGNALAFSALTWVVAHAVYAPGRITYRRLRGAAVVYLNLGTIFAAAFSLIWDLSPTALRQSSRRDAGAGRTRHDAVFQPYHADHDRGMAMLCRWIGSPAAWPFWSRSLGSSTSPLPSPAS